MMRLEIAQKGIMDGELSRLRRYDESTGQRSLRNSHGDKPGRNLKRVKSQGPSMAFAPDHSMRFCLAAVKIQFPARLSGCSPGIFSKGHKRYQRTHMHQSRTRGTKAVMDAALAFK